MKEKIKGIIIHLFNMSKYIFNMLLLVFTFIFIWAHYVYNPIVIIISICSLTLTFIINIFTKNKFNFWVFIRAFCLIKILLLCIYIESDMLLCVNEVNKGILDKTVYIGSNINISPQSSSKLLESLGATTLFFGSMLLVHKGLNYYLHKPGSGSGSASEGTTVPIRQPIFSEGVTSSESRIVPIQQPFYVDRATSPVPSEIFGSAISGSRSPSPEISETALSIGRCSSLEFLSGSVSLVDRSSSPGLSNLDSQSISSISNSSHFSPYPDTLSAPGLETIRTVSSIRSNVSSLSSSTLSSSSLSSEASNIAPEVLALSFNEIYRNIPVVNLSLVESPQLPKSHARIGSKQFMENPKLDGLINELIPVLPTREWSEEQIQATQIYLENMYKLGFCIKAISQGVDDGDYYMENSIVIDLINTYKLMVDCFSNTNLTIVYAASDILTKVFPKAKTFIGENDTLENIEIMETLFKGLFLQTGSYIPLDPLMYYKYQQALEFVNGVIQKDTKYTELIKKVTEKDLSILELTYKNLETSGLSTANCISLLKVGALCLFNVSLGPSDNMELLINKFLENKAVAMNEVYDPNVDLSDDFFVSLYSEASGKVAAYKAYLVNLANNIQSDVIHLIGEYPEVIAEKKPDGTYDYTTEEGNETKNDEVK